MTVLRQRHKNMILAGGIGFLLALVILILVYIVGVRDNPRFIRFLLGGQTIQVEEKESQEQRAQPILKEVYVFHDGLKENDIISSSDFGTIMMDQAYIPEGIIGNTGELIGKKIKCDSVAQMIATKNLVYEEKSQGDVKESVEMLDIKVPEFIQESDRINLRIHYPTGQDFLVLKDVSVTKIYEESQGCTLQLNHDEIVSLSSAKEDKNIYPGTLLYYTKDTESYSRAFVGEELRNIYPVNPNTIDYLTSKFNNQEVYEERILLDESLHIFFDQEFGAYTFTHIQEVLSANKDMEDVSELEGEHQADKDLDKEIDGSKEAVTEKQEQNTNENTQIQSIDF